MDNEHVIRRAYQVAEQKDVEIQIEQLAHALPEASRIIHHLFAQQPAMSGRIADHRVADDQKLAPGPVKGDLSR